MECFKLSVVGLVPFLLLAAIAVVTGDELSTIIVHVHPPENHVLATADDRNVYGTGRSYLRTAASSTHTTTWPAASQPG
jgi:hypothetical protein